MKPNTIFFVAVYLVLMAPTYVLPYFGSNSSLVNVVSAGAGMGMTPQWWAHAWSLGMLCLLSWARGGVIGRMWLPIFPFLAAIFDLMPLLNWIPLAPTLLHVGALLAGVIGVSENSDESAASHQAALNRKALWGAGAATVCALAGVAAFLMSAKNVSKALTAPVAAPKASNPALSSPAQPNVVETAKPAQPLPTQEPVSAVPPPKKDLPPPAKRLMVKPSESAKQNETAKSQKPSGTGTTTRYITLHD